MKQFRESQYYVTEDFKIYNATTKRFLTPYLTRSIRPNSKDYLGVCLYINRKPYFMFYHRIIAEVYLENPNNYPYINHIDSNTLNNSISNLEWVSASQNNIHAILSGRRNLKLNQEKADEIRELIKQGVSAKKIMEMYNIKSTLFYKIKNNQSWNYSK